MDVKLIITRDYEKIMYWTLGENKPKQSQSRIGKQRTEDRGQMADDERWKRDDGGQTSVLIDHCLRLFRSVYYKEKLNVDKK